MTQEAGGMRTGSICAFMSGESSLSSMGPWSPKRPRSRTGRAKGLRLQKRSGLATRIWPAASLDACTTDSLEVVADAPPTAPSGSTEGGVPVGDTYAYGSSSSEGGAMLDPTWPGNPSAF